MTYEQWRRQAAKRGDLNTESAWNAAIAARDEELKRQEPVVWAQDVEHEMTPEFAFSWVQTRLHDKPLYTAPMPEGEKK